MKEAVSGLMFSLLISEWLTACRQPKEPNPESLPLPLAVPGEHENPPPVLTSEVHSQELCEVLVRKGLAYPMALESKEIRVTLNENEETKREVICLHLQWKN